jgi:hypothetical protein
VRVGGDFLMKPFAKQFAWRYFEVTGPHDWRRPLKR